MNCPGQVDRDALLRALFDLLGEMANKIGTLPPQYKTGLVSLHKLKPVTFEELLDQVHVAAIELVNGISPNLV